MGRLHAATPLVLTALGFAGAGALFIRRLLLLPHLTDRVLAVGAAALYAGWLLWESRVSMRELARPEADHDRHTLEVAAVAKLALLAGLLLGGGAVPVFLAIPGLGAMTAGILLRVAAIRCLGAGYRHRISAPAGAIQRHGPYRRLRHPAYLGTLVAHAGLVAVLPNVWSVASLVLLWLPAVVLRTVVEDRWLLDQVPAYADYADVVRWRLIPGVW